MNSVQQRRHLIDTCRIGPDEKEACARCELVECKSNPRYNARACVLVDCMYFSSSGSICARYDDSMKCEKLEFYNFITQLWASYKEGTPAQLIEDLLEGDSAYVVQIRQEAKWTDKWVFDNAVIARSSYTQLLEDGVCAKGCVRLIQRIDVEM